MSELVTLQQPATQTLMKPIATPQQMITYHGDMIKLIQEALKEGTDYGVIPGTKKPTLYKAGAERINIAFGTHPAYQLVEKEIDHDREVTWFKEKKVWNNKHPGDKSFKLQPVEGSSLGLYRYVYKCQIRKADGTVVAEGEGVCSTLEAKYIERPRDAENTVCKMAQKRAFLAATLHAFGLSDQFTQDMEDHYQPPKIVAPPPPPPPPPPPTQEKRGSTLPPPLQTPLIFNKDEPKHQDKLIAYLYEKKIAAQFHDAIASELNGKAWAKDDITEAISKAMG